MGIIRCSESYAASDELCAESINGVECSSVSFWPRGFFRIQNFLGQLHDIRHSIVS